MLLDEAARFGVKLECVAGVVEGLNPREELGIEQDRVVVRRQPRGDLRLDLVQDIVRVRGRQCKEHVGNAGQQSARSFHRHDRVLEGR